jgi:hypothetical protein
MYIKTNPWDQYPILRRLNYNYNATSSLVRFEKNHLFWKNALACRSSCKFDRELKIQRCKNLQRPEYVNSLVRFEHKKYFILF